jgi:hypothetical protein
VREVGRPDHASTEQLSALLDDRAEPGEQRFLSSHVDRCAVCSNELADLRSIRSLLRALPVYLPPRSFTIPIEAVRVGRRFQRLIPLTRVLGTIAAVLCVVLFSVDAMRTGYDAFGRVQDGSGAHQITTAAWATSAPAAAPAAEPKSASESARPAAAVAKPAGDYGPPAAAAPPPQAAAPKAPSEAGAPASQSTSAAFIATQPSAAPTMLPVPTQAAGGASAGATSAVQRQPAAGETTILGLGPLRFGSAVLGLAAAVLLIGSVVLSRLAHTRTSVDGNRPRP